MNCKFLFLLITLLSFIQCDVVSQTASTKNNNKNCETIVTLRNFIEEANCGYLFETTDGTLLLPGKMPKTDIPFFEGQQVKIGFNELSGKFNKDDCKKADQVVEIFCIQALTPEELPDIETREQTNQVKEGPASFTSCKRITDPFKTGWIPKLVNKHKAKSVEEYAYNDGFLYLFINDKNQFLYDCLGNKLCDTMDEGDCFSLIETLEDPMLILDSNN